MNENKFYKQYLGEWLNTNDYVFSREQVCKLLEQGYIGKDKADYLVRLRYELKRGDRVIRDDDGLVDMDDLREIAQHL